MPPPMNIPDRKAPPWVYIAGVIFGALTLFFLFGLLVIGAVFHIDFTCQIPLLAPAVALGVASSAAFLGGAAATEGKLGDTIRGYSLAFSAGGGVSIFLIVLIAFPFLLGQHSCKDQEMTLELSRIPGTHQYSVDGGFWQRERQDPSVEGTVKSIILLLDRATRKGNIVIFRGQLETKQASSSTEAPYECAIKVKVFPNFSGLEKDYPTDERKNYKSVNIGASTSLEFLNPKKKGAGAFKNVKADDDVCFHHDNVPIYSNIMIAWDEGKLLFNLLIGRNGEPPRPQFSIESRWWDVDDQISKPTRPSDDAWFIMSAYAQTPDVTPYDKLRPELSSPDPNMRVRARQFLGAHFPVYANNVLSDLTLQNSDPNLIVSLLHGLITGIDNAEGGIHVPKAGRDIGKTARLPFIQGKEDDILELVTIDDESVKKQVRRLVQRFPYEVFRDSFARLFEKYHVQQDCEANQRTGANQSLIYAFSFFTYNQMVQIALNNPLSERIIVEIERIANESKKLANCLDKTLYIDSAIIDYGRATIYAQDKALKDRTQAAAKAFLEIVQGSDKNSGAEYYFKSHIDTIRRLAN